MWRHAAIGLTSGSGEAFQLPLTQTELGDTLGLTPVHVNRILKEFREQKLIGMYQKTLTLINVEQLQIIAGFNKDYLHLGGTAPEVVQYFDNLEKDRAL